jgi:hypothetical protein
VIGIIPKSLAAKEIAHRNLSDPEELLDRMEHYRVRQAEKWYKR